MLKDISSLVSRYIHDEIYFPIRRFWRSLRAECEFLLIVSLTHSTLKCVKSATYAKDGEDYRMPVLASGEGDFADVLL